MYPSTRRRSPTTSPLGALLVRVAIPIRIRPRSAFIYWFLLPHPLPFPKVTLNSIVVEFVLWAPVCNAVRRRSVSYCSCRRRPNRIEIPKKFWSPPPFLSPFPTPTVRPLCELIITTSPSPSHFALPGHPLLAPRNRNAATPYQTIPPYPPPGNRPEEAVSARSEEPGSDDRAEDPEVRRVACWFGISIARSSQSCGVLGN